MAAIDVHPRHLEIVIGILARHIPDREVRVMGSRLTGCAKSFSDLDLVIMGREPLSLSVRGELRDAFDDSSLPFTVDLAEWATASDGFRRVIAGQARVLRPAAPAGATAGAQPPLTPFPK